MMCAVSNLRCVTQWNGACSEVGHYFTCSSRSISEAVSLMRAGLFSYHTEKSALYCCRCTHAHSHTHTLAPLTPLRSEYTHGCCFAHSLCMYVCWCLYVCVRCIRDAAAGCCLLRTLSITFRPLYLHCDGPTLVAKHARHAGAPIAIRWWPFGDRPGGGKCENCRATRTHSVRLGTRALRFFFALSERRARLDEQLDSTSDQRLFACLGQNVKTGLASRCRRSFAVGLRSLYGLSGWTKREKFNQIKTAVTACSK